MAVARAEVSGHPRRAPFRPIGWRVQAAQAVENPYLSRERELELIRDFQSAWMAARVTVNDEERARHSQRADQAVTRLLLSQQGWIEAEAKKYHESTGGAVPVENLVSASYEGFMQALIQFKTGDGYRFTTYLRPWIKKKILEEIRENFPTKITEHFYKCLIEVKNSRKLLSHTLGHEPGREDIAKYLGWKLKTVDLYIGYESMRIISLEQSIITDEGEEVILGDILDEKGRMRWFHNDIEDDAIRSNSFKIIDYAVGDLPKIHRHVIERLFGLDRCEFRERSVEEVAKEMDVEVEQVIEVAEAALKLLSQKSWLKVLWVEF